MNDQISFDLPGQVKRKDTMNELAKREQPSDYNAFLAIIDKAAIHGVSVENLERMLAMAKDMRAEQAKAAYVLAMAEFQANCPAIPRKTVNSFFKTVDRNGVSKPRMYASLEDIGATIRPHLGPCGLSYKWSGMKVEGGVMSLDCIISHSKGHSERSTVSLPTESKAGASEAQKAGALMTYAQRYSLIQALGLTTCDEDDDGATASADVETITESQAADLDTAIENVKGNKVAFCRRFNIGRLSELPASKLGEALAMVEAKRREAMK
jgi:hypothetical protein